MLVHNVVAYYLRFQELHVAPFKLKLVGEELLPLHKPLKPILNEALAAILLFHDMFCAVTFAPL